MKKIIRIIILLLLIAIIVVSSICLYKELSERKIQNDEYENLIMLFENVSDNHEDDFRNKNNLEADNLSSEEKVSSKSYNFDSIKNINSDVVGWIKIDGTKVNYPVMQNSNDSNYYLHRNIYKGYSSIGSIYVPNICNIKKADNIILYGHHIKDGSMFGSLTKYKSYNYFKEHKYIKLMTDESSFSDYEIMAIIVTNVEDFNYYGFTKAENQNQFNEYVRQCRSMSIFETGVQANYGDKLVTLVTCEYSQNNGRMIIVAKKI